MTTAAIHPLDTTVARGGPATTKVAPMPGMGTTVSVNKPMQQGADQQQQQASWKAPSTETIREMYSQVTARASEVLPESLKTADFITPVRQVYDTTRTKVAAARESPQWNKMTTNVTRYLERAKQKAGQMMIKQNDPSHSKETMQIVSDAFTETRTIVGKMLFMVVMFAHFVLMALPDRLLHLFGVRNNSLPGKFRLEKVSESPAIWVGEYVMPVGSSNTIILQGRDGTLFIRSPPEPTQEVIQTIRQLGEPSALFLTLSHDTFGDRWKEMFPNAKILAMGRDAQSVSNRVAVDSDLESATQVLQNFNIERVISISEWSRKEEPVLILNLGQGRKAAMFGCGFTGQSQSSSMLSFWYWRDVVLGRTCLGMMSVYAYLFVKENKSSEAQLMWRQISEVQGLDTLLFLHGRPIAGDANLKAKMERVNLTHLRLAE